LAAWRSSPDEPLGMLQAGAGLVETELDVAAFLVELGVADTGHHLGGSDSAVQAHARVALFHGVVEVAGHAVDGIERLVDVFVLRLDLLHAHTIGLHRLCPGQEALVVGRTDPVQVQCHQAKSQGSTP